MKDRILASGVGHRSRLLALLGLGALLALALAINSFAGPVGAAAGFEDDDGNLEPQAPINFDWNSFDPTTWTGTAPNRTSSKTVSGWEFDGLEDAQKTTSDSAFPGGTKQDDACPSVITAKAPNKDDLKRVYFASKTVGGDVFLELAWVRIPQNTTSPSAHIAFEFNQSDTLCGAASDGLVQRTAGDMLIVYDFEGGSTDDPSINLSRWITSGACEVGSHVPPCWSEAVDLTAGGFAEGQVNTSPPVGPVLDKIGPSDETLGVNEFGEAGINLTDAGVFSENDCIAFGNAYAVSRTSGSSSTAQMKDLVGPGNVDIRNCGTVIMRKATVPSPDPTDTTFSYTTTGGLDPASFGLKDGQAQDYGDTVPAGSYSVTESDPGPDFSLTGLDCSASDLSNGSTVTPSTATRTVSFELKALDTVDCTFTNTLQQGAIKVTKTSSKDDSGLAGAEFDIDDADGNLVAHVTTDADGEACVDGLTFGDYSVTETDPPPGYAIDDSTAHSVTVDNAADCDDDPYGGESTSFSDTPLSEIQVQFRSLAGPGVTNASIVCEDSTPSAVDPVSENGEPDPALDDTDETFTDLPPDTYKCTVVVDP